MGFLPFLLSALAVLLALHFWLYLTTVRCFTVESRGVRIALFTVLIVLSQSFIGSALFLRLHRNPITEGFLVVASFWTGLVVYLVMALALIWLVKGIARLAGWDPDMRIVCGAFYGLALAMALYGTVNALFPRVTRMEIQIENLPEAWKGRTVVHLSDVHLGTIRRVGYLEGMVERVNALEPHMILITGDLFDGMGGRLESFIEPLSSFRASRGVFFVTGNHEAYLGMEGPLSILEKTPIRVLADEVVEVEGLQVVGIGYPWHGGDAANDNLLRLGAEIDPDKPSILMVHTPTDIGESGDDRSTRHSRSYFSPQVGFTFATRHGIDLQLSGHTHHGQIFPFVFLTRRIYHGYDYGLHRIGELSVYITSGAGTWGPPMRIGTSSEIVAIRLR